MDPEFYRLGQIYFGVCAILAVLGAGAAVSAKNPHASREGA